jgi:hypothetical protein
MNVCVSQSVFKRIKPYCSTFQSKADDVLTMLVSNCTCVQGEDVSVVEVAAMVENQVVVLCSISQAIAKPCR